MSNYKPYYKISSFKEIQSIAWNSLSQGLKAERVFRVPVVSQIPRTPRFFLCPRLPFLLASPHRIAQLRKRLCSLSWFIGRLNEFIARSANAEDRANREAHTRSSISRTALLFYLRHFFLLCSVNRRRDKSVQHR